MTASLRTQTNGTDDPAADPAVVVTQVLVPLVADTALREPHVQALLGTTHVGSQTLAELLQGVVLTDGQRVRHETARPRPGLT